MQTVTLSETAVAVLRFEFQGWKSKRPGSRLAAYRELAEAGIMEPVPGSEADYRFTEGDTRGGRRSCARRRIGSSAGGSSRRTRAISRRRPRPCCGGSLRRAGWRSRGKSAPVPRAGGGADHLPEAHIRQGAESGYRFTLLGGSSGSRLIGGGRKRNRMLCIGRQRRLRQQPASAPHRPPPPLPATGHQDPPRLVADRQIRLRRDPHRRVMVAAHPPFGVLVGHQRIPAVAEPGLRPQLPARLPYPW